MAIQIVRGIWIHSVLKTHIMVINTLLKHLLRMVNTNFDYLINELIDPKGEFNFSYDAFWKKNGTLKKQFVGKCKRN